MPARPFLWGGPAVDVWSELVRAHLDGLGLKVTLETQEYMDGGWFVWVCGEAGAPTEVLCMVVNWATDVAIVDPHEESVSQQEALTYLGARLSGATPKEAWHRVEVIHPRPPRGSLLRRILNRFRATSSPPPE